MTNFSCHRIAVAWLRARLPWCACWSMIIVVGCSQSNVVHRSDAQAWVPEAREDLLGEEADVRLRDGATLRGEILRVDTDSLVVAPEGGGRVGVSLDSVSAVKMPVSYLVPIGGAIFGGLAGGLIGGVLGMESTISSPSEETALNTVSGTFIGIAVGAVAGGAIMGVSSMAHEYAIIPDSAGNPAQGHGSGVP